MSAPKSHTTVVAPRSHVPLPPPVSPSAGSPVRMWRWALAAFSLIGIVASVIVGLLALTHPMIFPIAEFSSGRHSVPFGIGLLVGGCALISLAMMFLMPAPWYQITFFGLRRRRQNWFVVAGAALGFIASVSCGGWMMKNQIHAPVAAMRNGHYELRQNFQTVREISAEEYAALHNEQQHQPVAMATLAGSLFCLFVYLSQLLYSLWYLRTEPEVDWRDGFWDQFLR